MISEKRCIPLKSDNQDVLTVRVGKELKKAFADMAESSQETKAQLFEDLIHSYKGSKQEKDIVNLRDMQKELENTFHTLEKRLIDTYAGYNDRISELQKKAEASERQSEENKKLLALIMNQQEELRSRKKQLADQEDMLNYLTLEVEQLQQELERRSPES